MFLYFSLLRTIQLCALSNLQFVKWMKLDCALSNLQFVKWMKLDWLESHLMTSALLWKLKINRWILQMQSGHQSMPNHSWHQLQQNSNHLCFLWSRVNQQSRQSNQQCFQHHSRHQQCSFMMISQVQQSRQQCFQKPLSASTMLIHDDLTIQRRKQHISQTVKHNMTVNTHKHKNICRLCFKSFKHILALRKHQIEDHDNRRPQYTCTYCHKVFISKDSYRGHKSVHRMEIIGRCKNN